MDTATTTEQTETATATAPPEQTPPTEPTPTDTGQQTTTSPEDQPGGAGDELPARSQAMFTGRGGQIGPRVILVPPFISVRVELRSADGKPYELSGEGRRLTVDSNIASRSTTFDGLRPGRRIILRGTGGRVVIEASAEPGP